MQGTLVCAVTDDEESADALALGVELSERLGLERFQAAVLATRGAAAGSRDDLQRAIAIAERASFVNELLRGLNNLGEHVLHGGDLAATQEIFGRMRAVCEEFGVLAQLRWLDGQELAVGFDSGDWSRALELGRGLIEDAEAGRRHYLAAGAYIVRAAIRQARDEGGYHEDAELALAHARRAADPQQLCPCLAFEAWIAARDGRTARTRAYFDEAFEIGVRTTGSTYAWMPMFVCAAGELAEHDRYRRLLAGERPGPWVDAALATCDGDFAGAAERYRAMGALNVEAEARLFAARGSAAAAAQQLTLALDYFRSVGATARVRAAESVLAATA